jgi:anti-sigma B factor antagonist
MTQPLTITRRTVGRVVILELTGQLKYDEEGDRLLRQEVASVVAEGQRDILLDLHGVHQMDSGGVGILVAVYLHTVKRGGRLKLLQPSERVARVLHTTHLESAFEVFHSEDDAVRTFAIGLSR